MNFTPEQRLIASLLCDIHQRLEIRHSYDSDLILEALKTRNEWAIQMEYGEALGVVNPLREEASFVCKVLEMCEILEQSYANLDAPDQAKVREQTRINPANVFTGFDRNNDVEFTSIVEFLVTKLGRFNYLQGRDQTALTRPRDCYSRMLTAYSALFEKRMYQSNEFTPEDIVSILNEHVDPTNL